VHTKHCIMTMLEPNSSFRYLSARMRMAFAEFLLLRVRVVGFVDWHECMTTCDEKRIGEVTWGAAARRGLMRCGV
jgi:hypothetical protein